MLLRRRSVGNPGGGASTVRIASMSSDDLRRYLEITEFLQLQQRSSETNVGRDRAPSWGDATNEWVRKELGFTLEDPQLSYFIDGVNLLAGNFIKAGYWIDEQRDPVLDREVWLFYRAWVDHYGPIYPTDPAF
jgi:hypothetical protein